MYIYMCTCIYMYIKQVFSCCHSQNFTGDLTFLIFCCIFEAIISSFIYTKLYMYIYMYIYVHVYVHVHVHIHVHIHVYVHVYVHIHVHVHGVYSYYCVVFVLTYCPCFYLASVNAV